MNAKLHPATSSRHFPQEIKRKVITPQLASQTGSTSSVNNDVPSLKDVTQYPERFGVSLDPFGSLNMKMNSSTQKLVHHCAYPKFFKRVY